MNLNHMLSYKILGNSLSDWGAALLITLFGFSLLVLARKITGRYVSKLDGEKRRDVTGMLITLLGKTYLPLFLIIFCAIGFRTLHVSRRVLPWLSAMAVAAMIVQTTVWALALVDLAADRYREKALPTDSARISSLRAISFAVKLLILIVAILLLLDNIPGVKITTLVASLGIGGVAVALAVQNILSDLFASFSIMFDRPFVIGDFIIVDDYMGTIEHIGLKTTRIRSLSGEQLVFSNNDLLKSRIRNYKRMSERRVVFTIGVLYQTPIDKLREIPVWIKNIIVTQGLTRFDRAHFRSFGDYSLIFETVYYVLDPDYNRYMDIQQAINLAICEKFESEGIKFAFPTRTIHIPPVSKE
jgi:small-conductance mechanosensitive channel